MNSTHHKIAIACSINFYNEIQSVVYSNINKGSGRVAKYDIEELSNLQGAYFLTNVAQMQKETLTGTLVVPIVITELHYTPKGYDNDGREELIAGLNRLKTLYNKETSNSAAYLQIY